MKLLVVLVGALVAVAHAKVLAADEAENVYTLEQSPEASEGQVAYAAEEGAPQEVRVFGAEEKQSAGSPQESENSLFQQVEGNLQSLASEGLYIPVLTRTCTNSACAYICGLVGFKHGRCISSTTCNCYN